MKNEFINFTFFVIVWVLVLRFELWFSWRIIELIIIGLF